MLFFSTQTSTFYRAAGIPLTDPNLNHPERYEAKVKAGHFHQFQFEDLLARAAEDPSGMVHTDIIIIGSGSGAGVAAKNISEWNAERAKKGKRRLEILMLEKGRYFPHEELVMTEGEALANMYDKGMVLKNEEGGVSFGAASTFGGGSAVNWSASLRVGLHLRIPQLSCSIFSM